MSDTSDLPSDEDVAGADAWSGEYAADHAEARTDIPGETRAEDLPHPAEKEPAEGSREAVDGPDSEAT